MFDYCIVMKTLKVIAAYRLTLIVFLLITFRPHVLGFIRREVLNDRKVCTSKVHTTHIASFITDEPGEDYGDDGCSDDDESCSSSTDNSYYEDGTTDDGCSDEDDSCDDTSSDDDSYDYSSDDGCSEDDESCSSADDDPYDEDQSEYADDGCACEGATVINSDVNPPVIFYNSTVQLNMTFANSSGPWSLKIENSSSEVLAVLFSNTTFGNRSFNTSWDGYYGNGHFIPEGTFYAVLSSTRGHITDKKSFYYTGQHGFQVDATSSNILEFNH